MRSKKLREGLHNGSRNEKPKALTNAVMHYWPAVRRFIKSWWRVIDEMDIEGKTVALASWRRRFGLNI